MTSANAALKQPTSPGKPAKKNSPWRVASATLLGTSVEWYDFGIYGFAAAVIFPTVFFPNMPGPMAVLASFATLAVGSLGRPIGAAIFGHIGDRYGRRKSLVYSLMLMGVATLLIGVLPGYATIGYAAPIILLIIRILQSLAAGGEWGGALLFAVESAPKKWRAFFGSFTQMGSGVGFFLASGAFALISLLGEEAVLAWAWRLPFFASIALIAVGLIIRSQLDETEAFKRAEQQSNAQENQQLPLFEVFRSAWGVLLLGIGAFLVTIAGFYIIVTYTAAYAAEELGLSTGEIANAGMFASLLAIVLTPVAAIAADKYGVRNVTLIGLALHLVVAAPMFMALNSGTVAGLYICMGLGMTASIIAYAPIGTLVAGWFTTRVRQTGISLSYQIAGVLGGGLTPVIAQWLHIEFGGTTPVAIFFAAMGAVSLVCVLVKPGPGHLDFGDKATRGSTEEIEVAGLV